MRYVLFRVGWAALGWVVATGLLWGVWMWLGWPSSGWGRFVVGFGSGVGVWLVSARLPGAVCPRPLRLW